jgi:hypothetical protein
MPALPLDDAGPYVAAAYLVFLALILIYVAIMASKLVRIGREISEINELLDRRERRAEARGDGSAEARGDAAAEARGDAAAEAHGDDSAQAGETAAEGSVSR